MRVASTELEKLLLRSLMAGPCGRRRGFPAIVCEPTRHAPTARLRARMRFTSFGTARSGCRPGRLGARGYGSLKLQQEGEGNVLPSLEAVLLINPTDGSIGLQLKAKVDFALPHTRGWHVSLIKMHFGS